MTQVRYNYVFVRKDLSLAQQIVQACHASHESGLHLCEFKDKVNHLILCSVENVNELYKIANKLDNLYIRYKMFFEPDIDQHTAIATEPVINKKFFKNYKLWKPGEKNEVD